MEHFFKGYPLFSMLLPKVGGVPAHPANVHRLLYDEEQLVLVFPEGRKGTEKLYKDRYRLRGFGRGGFVESAMRARRPIVPIAVVGAEEAAPIFAHLTFLQRLTGLLYVPLTPTFPHGGILGMFGYLPAKLRIRFLDPIPTTQWGDEPWKDRALVQTVAEEIRALIQEELYGMLAKRTGGSRPRGTRTAIRRARRCRPTPRLCACARSCAAATSPTATSARSRSSCAAVRRCASGPSRAGSTPRATSTPTTGSTRRP